MRALMRLVAIFAVAFPMTQPVLACALMVGDKVIMAAVEEGDTPCHQKMADNSLRPQSGDSETGQCPAGDGSPSPDHDT